MRLGVTRRAAMQREVSRAAKAMLERSGAGHVKRPDEFDFRRTRHQRLRGHVASGARARGGQSRPGLSRRSRPADVRAKAAEAVLDGWNQYPPMIGPARIARGDRRPLPALPGSRTRSRERGHGDLGRDRGARRRAARADRAGRRGRAVPADVRRLSAAGAPRRRRAEVRDPEAAALDLRRGRSRRRVLRRARASSCSTIRSTRPASSTTANRSEILARACVKYDAIALCDEVWEHVVFDDRRHVPLMAMEGMRERTVKIGSAGKIFSLTGWKVGFVCASAARSCASWPRRISSSPSRRRPTCRPPSPTG